MAQQTGIHRGQRGTTGTGGDDGPEFPIPVGQTNAALGTTIATVGAIAALFGTPALDALLGPNASAVPRAVVVVGILTAWAIVTASDLIARALAAGHGRGDAGDAGRAAARTGRPTAGTPTVTVTTGVDTSGWTVFAIDDGHAIVGKAGEAVRSVPFQDLVLDEPGRSGGSAAPVSAPAGTAS